MGKFDSVVNKKFKEIHDKTIPEVVNQDESEIDRISGSLKFKIKVC